MCCNMEGRAAAEPVARKAWDTERVVEVVLERKVPAGVQKYRRVRNDTQGSICKVINSEKNVYHLREEPGLPARN